MPSHTAGTALLTPAAMGVIGALGVLQWWVAGMASPIKIIKVRASVLGWLCTVAGSASTQSSCCCASSLPCQST